MVLVGCLLKDLHSKAIQEITLELSRNINEVFILRDNYQTAIREYKAIGEKTAIENSIQQIQKEINELNEKAGFTEAETNNFARLQRIKTKVGAANARLEVYLERLTEYVNELNSAKQDVNQRLESGPLSWFEMADDNYAQRFISKNSTADRKESDELFDKLLKKYANIETAITKNLDIKKQRISDLETLLIPYSAKISNQDLLGKLKATLEQELGKLKQLEEKAKQLAKIKEDGGAMKKKILENVKKQFETYNLILAKIKTPALSQIGNGLELKTSLDIDSVSFQNGFCGLLDGRSNFSAIFGACFDASNNYLYSTETHVANLESLFEKVWSAEANQIKFKSGYNAKDAINQLLKDNYRFKYNIIYNEDDILQMSPGKRGLVLMQIILHLSNAKHPILIDQPEDNLDNRTIFNDLNEFIKEKKIQRQIILVTHNANLVVSTDAEQVIVANQNGQDKGKSNEKYQFEYVSGSLENTFRNASHKWILQQMGIREHVCDILEGGEAAFQYREKKYGFR